MNTKKISEKLYPSFSGEMNISKVVYLKLLCKCILVSFLHSPQKVLNILLSVKSTLQY